MHLGHQGAVQALKLVQVLHLIRLVFEALLGSYDESNGSITLPFSIESIEGYASFIEGGSIGGVVVRKAMC